jgi:dihydrofolate synthase/folylpolyglutamate synthase
MPSRSLGEWLAYLETLHPSNIELGLDRVSAVAERLSITQPGPAIVTVAGTNGKGSTSALLEAIALDAGMRVGVYTSPHLLHYNERVRVNGDAVADDVLIGVFETVEENRGNVPLTYFEYGTLAALLVFMRQPLDLLILEVGLGGRLDAVNIIDPDVAVITSISLDHESWLGCDRESIGREKAGILRPGIRAVIADPEPPASVLEELEALDCRCEFYQPGTMPDLPASSLREENIYAALAAARILGIEPAAAGLRALLTRLVLPGRLQQLQHQGIEVVLDVAHNPAAVENLVAWLEGHVARPRVALFAALSDKDIHAMIRACSGVFDYWYVADLPGVARALDAHVLAEAVTDAGLPLAAACTGVEDAWRCAGSEQPGAVVVVFGSFYTVAGFMKLLGEGHEQA